MTSPAPQIHHTTPYPPVAAQQVAWVRSLDGQLVPVDPAQLPAREVPAPQPVVAVPAAPQGDVWPMRLAGAGVCAAGVGWGASLLLSALAAATAGLAALAVCLLAVWLLRAGNGRGAGQGVNVDIRIDNRGH